MATTLLGACSPTTTTQETTTTINTESNATQTDADLSALIYSNPAEVDNSTLPITPVEQLHLAGFYQQEVNIDDYRLTIGGLVDKPLSLTYEAFMQYPSISDTVLLICPEVFADNAKFIGVPVSTLLSESGINTEATGVTFYALDEYHVSLSLKNALSEGTFLAYSVNDQILPKTHGYPLRLVVTGEFGAGWVKWVERIEVN